MMGRRDVNDFDTKTKALGELIQREGTFDEFTKGYQALLDEVGQEQQMVTSQSELVL